MPNTYDLITECIECIELPLYIGYTNSWEPIRLEGLGRNLVGDQFPQTRFPRLYTRHQKTANKLRTREENQISWLTLLLPTSISGPPLDTTVPFVRSCETDLEVTAINIKAEALQGIVKKQYSDVLQTVS